MNAMNSTGNTITMLGKLSEYTGGAKDKKALASSSEITSGSSESTISSNTSNSSSEITNIGKHNDLTIDDIFRFMELYFNRAGIMYSHLYNSFNKFLDEDVKVFLENGDHTFFEKVDKNKIYRYKFKYENVTITPPMMENGVEPMFPSDARNRSLVYGGRLMAKVTQLQEVIDIATDEKTVRVIGQPEENVPIANMPLMLKSAYCSLTLYKNYDKTECEYDPGGYFIVNGSEKVVIAQDRMCDNKPLVFIRKESGMDIYTVQVNSKSYKPHGISQAISVRIKKDGILTIRVPILSEIPVLILFRALGVESDRDIINYIAYDEHDHDLVDALRVSLEECKNERGIKIQTKEDAILYLMSKMRVIKKYSETDKNVKHQQKKLHLLNLLENGFLPHIEGGIMQKAIYLGYMINKLLECYIGRTAKDDRDSYINKRIDLPGTLIDELFRQFYRKMMNECTKFFKKRNPNDDDPIVVINQIKPNVIEQGLKTALLTGSWIRRKGVAQMLQRYTYLQTLSFLRRVDAPGGDASTSKLTSPRELHPSSIRWLCCLTGDTEILMGDNATVQQIKNIRNGDVVISVYKDTLTERISKVQNYFKKGPERILKITTISGREIKCTLDHKLFVKISDNDLINPVNINGECILNETRGIGTFDYKEAIKLKVGDMLVARHTQKYIPVEKETKVILKSTDVDIQYKDELKDLGFLDIQIPQYKLEITARLLGASITDGHVGIKPNDKHYYSIFCVGEEKDAFEILDDIVKLGFDTPMIQRTITKFYNKKKCRYIFHKTFRVEKGGVFAYYLATMGAFIGKKTKMDRTLPLWLINANKRIKREFISGFVGGDGSKIAYWKQNDISRLSFGAISQSTYPDYSDSTQKYMESLKVLFNEFGINCEVKKRDSTTEKIEEEPIVDVIYDENENQLIDEIDIIADDELIKVDEDIENDRENAIQYLLTFSQTYDNLEKYIDYIGYRYCNQKRRASSIAIEYIKYRNYIAKAKDDLYDIIRTTYDKGLQPKQIANAKNISYNIVRRVIASYKKGVILKPSKIVDDYLKYDDFKKYYIKDDKILSQISSIVEIEPEMVYDFEVNNETHSFIANGIISSNCIQTPEHSKVGQTKHVSIIGNVTIMQTSQIAVIKSFLKKKIVNVQDVNPETIKNYTKVFLNGEWLGLSSDPFKLKKTLDENKSNGTFDPIVSITHDIVKGEIKIYCDGGRGYAPAMKVKDNVVQLTKKHIDSISLNKSDTGKKITTWEEFMLKNPGIIEYVDMEEQQYLMFADKINRVEEMRQRMIKSIDVVKNIKSNDVDNRYDDSMFIKYTHCEFHPSFLIGEISTNIPFCNSNQGPRNIFQYAQGRCEPLLQHKTVASRYFQTNNCEITAT